MAFLHGIQLHSVQHSNKTKEERRRKKREKREKKREGRMHAERRSRAEQEFCLTERNIEGKRNSRTTVIELNAKAVIIVNSITVAYRLTRYENFTILYSTGSV